MSADNNKQAGGFEKLLGELDTMTKALPAAEVADDKKIQAAAGADGAEGENKDKLDADGNPIAADPMAKSFQVTLADGSVIEAQDGTELVKSLFERVDSQEDLMVKAMGGVLDLVKSQTSQITSLGDLVKSLQTKVEQLSGQGAGRKSIVDVHQQATALTKSMGEKQQGPSAEEIMAKSNAAFTAGKITGQELNIIDVSMRSGFPIDQALAAKVLA